ncbi:aromatic-ring-hydroxylating dioxygenase subunit beta [Thiomonas sp. FB-6]|uniref:aromatic-ring-hydroxylating dioxygenase subunit beta n=1 Tax=Thiomonas sp. FB-6 TaxID=1158291 RepID=UPI000362AAB2|nr:aromatic-ring-hydroxylating dioxygenase subunit beta [Thiomonas sp. FB-6]
MSLPDDAAMADFVLHEARLLDTARYQDWLELFAADGRYWVPLQGAEQDPARPHNAYADEDRLLLRLRIERLQDARAWSQQPRSRGQHLLQTPRVERREAARALLYTPFLYVEARGDEQLMLAGHWQHSLCVEGGALRIALKRVNLVNAGASLPMIQLFP